MSLLSEAWGEQFDSWQFGGVIRPDGLFEPDHARNYANRAARRNDLALLTNHHLGPNTPPAPDPSTDNDVPADDTRGLMMDVLENLPQNKLLIVEVGNELQCAICHEHAKLQDNLRVLPCTHRFHQTCIDVWLLQKLTCPLCRVNVLDTLFTDRGETFPGSESGADQPPPEPPGDATRGLGDPNVTEILRHASPFPRTRLDTRSLRF